MLGVNSRIGCHVNPCIICVFVFQYRTEAKTKLIKLKKKMISDFVLNWKVDKMDNGPFSSLDNLDLRQGV